jgi:hypothetical protein
MTQQTENDRGGNPRGINEGSERDGSDDPEVPSGVLRGIDDMVMGRTASAEEIENVLKF